MNHPTPTSAPLMILIAGPYRSGTADDPAKMAANVRAMEAYALPLFRAGHIPVVGEWFALPLVALAGCAWWASKQSAPPLPGSPRPGARNHG